MIFSLVGLFPFCLFLSGYFGAFSKLWLFLFFVFFFLFVLYVGSFSSSVHLLELCICQVFLDGSFFCITFCKFAVFSLMCFYA